MVQGQAYWYSYKTKKVYHAPETHAYFIYDTVHNRIDDKKLKIFGISKADIQDLIDLWGGTSNLLESIKKRMIDKGWGIRFGLNVESLYFEIDEMNPEKFELLHKLARRIKVPMDRRVTIDTMRTIYSYKKMEDFFNNKRKKKST